MQNKYIHFCLKFDKLHDMSEEDFKATNWFACRSNSTPKLEGHSFQYVNNVWLYYIREVFGYDSQSITSSNNNYATL